MAKNRSSKKALEPLKNQIAGSLGINLSDGANLTTAQTGKVGGQMVKQIINSYSTGMKG